MKTFSAKANEVDRKWWIIDAKDQLNQRLELLDDYGRSVTVPYQDFVHDNAVRSTRARKIVTLAIQRVASEQQ